MARKIMDQLFRKNASKKNLKAPEQISISLEDWRDFLSRIDRIQSQLDSCNEKTDFLYAKVLNWLTLMRKKLNAMSKNQKELESATHHTLQQMEQKIQHWLEPEKTKQTQKNTMELMHRHSQFIRSYDKNLHSLSKCMSKNEYQIYQLSAQVRAMQIELDAMNCKMQNQEVVQASMPSHLGLDI